jgi:NAD(P)-dependent dehydrogenase (short-subunit alcohol dehydrogenase family)
MRKRLKDRVAVITGASAGIGSECARLFAEAGAHVVIAARRLDRLEALRQEIEAKGGRCLAVQTDVTDRALMQRLLDATLEHFGRVNVWINNAGSGLAASVEQTTPGEMERIWAVNYMGVFHGCQVALQQMRRQGRGHIINISSMAGRFAMPLGAAYSAAKFAVNGLSEALALELHGTGIRVSVIMPGFTATEFFDAMQKKIPDAPMPRIGIASARSVAARTLQCALRPREKVYSLPAPPLTLAFFDLFPSLWRWIALRYLQMRTQGRGTPVPGEEDAAR